MLAACLLKEQGLDVIGIHFIQHTRTHPPQKILDLGRQLEIPVEIIDIRTEFQEKIVDYFKQSYRQGRTPNPCMRCNPAIKFGTILSRAHSLGAQKLATGHYAIVKKDRHGGVHLYKGIDRQKDQSYFLARLTRRQLEHACFPLGKMEKPDVKEMAAQKGLTPVSSAESQDVCFIKNGTYRDFLSAQKGFEPDPGLIEDSHGRIIGKHGGLHLYTIGQRRGINCPAAEPYYVIRLDTARNRLIVGAKNDLAVSEFRVVDINWIGEEPRCAIDVSTRVRYRSREADSTILPQSGNSAIVRFKEPQTAVTPGQGAVFYRGEEILGGGWIE